MVTGASLCDLGPGRIRFLFLKPSGSFPFILSLLWDAVRKKGHFLLGTPESSSIPVLGASCLGDSTHYMYISTATTAPRTCGLFVHLVYTKRAKGTAKREKPRHRWCVSERERLDVSRCRQFSSLGCRSMSSAKNSRTSNSPLTVGSDWTRRLGPRYSFPIRSIKNRTDWAPIRGQCDT